MTDLKPAKATATGYFKAKRNNQEFYNSENVSVNRGARWIEIQSYDNFGPNGIFFKLLIDQATPPGQQDFVREGYLYSVEYTNGADGMKSAYAGTFTATLNNVTKRYQLIFNLKFYSPDNLELEGEFDITE